MRTHSSRKSPSGRGVKPRPRKAKATKKANGKKRTTQTVATSLTPTWQKIFGELGKVESMSRAALTKIAEKYGAKGWYGRFVRGGIVARESGQYWLTKAGKKLVK